MRRANTPRAIRYHLTSTHLTQPLNNLMYLTSSLIPKTVHDVIYSRTITKLLPIHLYILIYIILLRRHTYPNLELVPKNIYPLPLFCIKTTRGGVSTEQFWNLFQFFIPPTPSFWNLFQLLIGILQGLFVWNSMRSVRQVGMVGFGGWGSGGF